MQGGLQLPTTYLTNTYRFVNPAGIIHCREADCGITYHLGGSPEVEPPTITTYDLDLTKGLITDFQWTSGR